MKLNEFLEKYPDMSFGQVNVKRLCEDVPGQEEVPFYTSDYYSYMNTDVIVLNKFEIYLEHSCDEWVIGDINEAKLFFKDLFNAIAYIEEQLKETK